VSTDRTSEEGVAPPPEAIEAATEALRPQDRETEEGVLREMDAMYRRDRWMAIAFVVALLIVLPFILVAMWDLMPDTATKIVLVGAAMVLAVYNCASMVAPYEPPVQSLRGQIVDSVIIMALLFAVLFGVTYYVQSSASSEAPKETPIAKLPITAAEKVQYQRMIDKEIVDLPTVNAQVAASHPRGDKYPIVAWKLILTFGVIGGYLVFVYMASFKEYREVIRERFGPGEAA
jgi:hypothetical protein